jgi:hypothetical protein
METWLQTVPNALNRAVNITFLKSIASDYDQIKAAGDPLAPHMEISLVVVDDTLPKVVERSLLPMQLRATAFARR